MVYLQDGNEVSLSGLEGEDMAFRVHTRIQAMASHVEQQQQQPTNSTPAPQQGRMSGAQTRNLLPPKRRASVSNPVACPPVGSTAVPGAAEPRAMDNGDGPASDDHFEGADWHYNGSLGRTSSSSRDNNAKLDRSASRPPPSAFAASMFGDGGRLQAPPAIDRTGSGTSNQSAVSAPAVGRTESGTSTSTTSGDHAQRTDSYGTLTVCSDSSSESGDVTEIPRGWRGGPAASSDEDAPHAELEILPIPPDPSLLQKWGGGDSSSSHSYPDDDNFSVCGDELSQIRNASALLEAYNNRITAGSVDHTVDPETRLRELEELLNALEALQAAGVLKAERYEASRRGLLAEAAAAVMMTGVSDGATNHPPPERVSMPADPDDDI
eukprot:COSAG05_NODE_1025_length_6123_cov_5.086985_1_plen_380_part_00